jgi:hypothetical protein
VKLSSASTRKYSRLLLVLSFVLIFKQAGASQVGGELMTGLAMGRSTEPQKVLVSTSFESFKGCMTVGTATLADGRVQIALEEMTCSDGASYYVYSIDGSYVMDKERAVGIKAKHVGPSKQLLASLKPVKRAYELIGDEHGLETIRDAELGHWDIEAGIGVAIVFKNRPLLKQKVDSEN